MAYIELVIKIPEEMYEWVNDVNKFFDDYRISDFIDLVKNGTPLPKRHGEIIDATFALEAKITKDNNGISDRTKGWNEACQAIYENTPIIIEAESEG